MEYNTPQLQQLPLSLKSSRQQIEAFLARFGLRREPLDYYVGLFDGEQMIGGGGYAGRTIKCVAVNADRQGEGLTNVLISHLCARLFHDGATNVFLFTKPENERVFTDLSFTTIARTNEAILMESERGAIDRYCATLALSRGEGVQGAVVMNANPFTLGHRYLLEQAAAQCGTLHLFCVEEDRSVFPFAVRRRLMEEGTRHIPNLVIHNSGPYIISSATFPTYFLKENSEPAAVHARLDVDLFGRHIVPALGLTRRFVGTEPKDPMTAHYNDAMQALLPAYGVTVTVLQRIEQGNDAISASRVRRAWAAGEMDQVAQWVPETTLAYLQSEEAKPVLERLKEKYQ